MLHISGGIHELQTAWAAMLYQPGTNFNGTRDIQVVASASGVPTHIITLSVSVSPVNDQPWLDSADGDALPQELSVTPDQFVSLPPLQVHDADIECGLGSFTDRIQVQLDMVGVDTDRLKFSGAAVTQVQYDPAFGEVAQQISLDGPLAAVNTALAQVQVQLDGNDDGHRQLHIVINDMSNGGGEAMVTTPSISISLDRGTVADAGQVQDAASAQDANSDEFDAGASRDEDAGGRAPVLAKEGCGCASNESGNSLPLWLLGLALLFIKRRRR